MSEPDVSQLLSVAEAIAIIDAVEVTPRVVEVPLDRADGFRLAREIVADRDYPPFDKSLMDGYAVRCADVATTPVELRVAGEIPAGSEAARGLAPQEAIAIMTGAPLPDGADGVVPVEDTERVGDRVRIHRGTSPGRFIAKTGSDVRAGAVVLEKGTTLGPAQLAVAASVGAARVSAFAKPQVAILATGDELVPFDQPPSGAQIRNSNSIMLVALLRRLRCDVTDLGNVRDDPKLVRDALQNGMTFDVLFVTGGMSMGQYDYVPRTLIELGADLKITKLRIKPGKPFVFATHGTPMRYVFGLPGNPVSGFVCTVRLASRLLARLSGGIAQERLVDAKLANPLAANGPREFYQPVFLDAGMVTPLQWKSSADIYSLARANALLARAENEPALAAGASVRVIEL
jgi:molybdopterin molybdotransferase